MFGVVIAKHPVQSAKFRPFKPLLLFMIAFGAAFTFEYAMTLALNVNLWFENGIVLGMNAPVTTGFLTTLSLILIVPSYYLLHKTV